MKRLVKQLSFFVLLVVATAIWQGTAEAQYNAFKDPTVKKDVKASATDFVAVENNIKGGKVAVGSKAFIVVLFKNQGVSPVKVTNINLYPSSTVTSQIALNQCSDTPLSQDSQCAITVEVLGKQGGAYRVEVLVEHDGNSRISTASISGDVELMAEKRESGEKKGVEMRPKLLDFGTSPGGIPVSRSVTLSNGSGDPVTIKDIVLNIADRSGFTVDSACPEELKSEENCNIIVTWKPTTKGVAQGVLAVNHTGRQGVASIEVLGDYNPLEKQVDGAEGDVEFSTSELGFGTSPGGIPMSRSLTLSNKTVDAVSLKGLSIDASKRAGFDFTSQCGETLEPGESCVVVVRWTPTATGDARGVLTAKHTGRVGVASVELSAKHTPPPVEQQQEVMGGNVELSPEVLDFGASAGGVAMVRPVMLTNNSMDTVEIWDIHISASDQAGFTKESQCFEFLAPRESCVVMVKWKPGIKGVSQGVLTVHHSGRTSMVSIEVTGKYDPPPEERQEKVVGGDVEISPEALDFGTSTGGIEMVRPVTIRNKTLSPVTINDIGIVASDQAGFSHESRCPQTLNVDGSCLVMVKWKPGIKGVSQGALAIQHSGTAGSASIEVMAKYDPAPEQDDEEVVGGDVEISPKDLDFGMSAGGIEMVRPVTIRNKTLRPITIHNISIEASDQAGFSYNSRCPQTLNVEGSCLVMVRWKPGVKGLSKGALAVQHSGTSGSASIEVTAKFDPPPEQEDEEIAGGNVELSPEELDFGISDSGVEMVRPVTIRNKSLEPVSIKDITIVASGQTGFSHASRCPETLSVDESCVVMVKWQPGVKGLLHGVLELQHSGKTGSASIEIKAKYEPPAATEEEEIAGGNVEISPEELDFGNSSGGLAMVRPVTIRNKSLEPVTIKEVTIEASEETGFSYASRCPQILPVNAGCLIMVKWKPGARGIAAGALAVHHTGTEGSASIEIRGVHEPTESEEEMVGGNVELSPEELDFGISTGALAMVRPVTIRNKTLGPVNIEKMAITASEKSGFSHESLCPQTLGMEASCVVLVKWEPNAKGSAQGALTVHHTGKTGQVSMEIKGAYEPPAEEQEELKGGDVEISPEDLDFGSSAGGITMVRPVTIRNKTLEPVTITKIAISASEKAGFSHLSQCPEVLNVDGSCLVMVSWEPGVKGLAQGALAVHHTGKSGMSSIEVKGKFEPAQDDEDIAGGDVELSPEELDFGSIPGGEPLVRPVTIRNKTLEAIEIEEISIEASERSGFSYHSKCPDTLEVDGGCVVMVKWKPNAEGLVLGALTVHHTGRSGIATMEIRAQYEPLPADQAEAASAEIEIMPDALDFGTSPGGITVTRPVVVRNKTLEPIEIEEVAVEAAARSGFSYKSKCPEVLEAKGSCMVLVNWKPSVKGLAQGVLSVQHSGNSRVTTIEVSATLEPAEATNASIYPSTSINQGLLIADRDAIDFGTGIREEASLAVSLVNSGDAPLTLNKISLAGFGSGVYISESGCHTDLDLYPGEACPLILNWIPDRQGAIADSLQILHTGARGVLVLPVSGTAEEVASGTRMLLLRAKVLGESVSEYYEDYVYDTLSDDDVEGMDPEKLASAVRDSDGKLDITTINKKVKELEGKIELEGFRVTSHSSSRAVLKGTKHSIIVRDGEVSVINGTKWNVAIVPTGVVLTTSGGKEVELLFDKALKSSAELSAEEEERAEEVEEAINDASLDPPTLDSLQMIAP